MQFNQTNKNAGDVNNTISERGNAVQTVGSENKVEVDHAKASFWSMLWKKVTAWWNWLVG